MPELKKIVLVDSDNECGELLRQILQGRYAVLKTDSNDEAMNILRANRQGIMLIILNLDSPSADVCGFLRVLQKEPVLQNIPVIVATSDENAENVRVALAAGAADFLRKPFREDITRLRIDNIINLRDNTAKLNGYEKDALTQVCSKEYFYERLQELIHENPDEEYDIICSDIENFKLVNDTYGFKFGDGLLIHMAGIMSEAFPEVLLCGRIGSDIFGIVVPRPKEYREASFVDIVEALNVYPIVITLSVRFGIYQINDKQLLSAAMCDRALLAIYSIKGCYGSIYAVYDDVIRQQLLAEQEITDSMVGALRDKQFKVYFQAKYNLGNENLAGAEALVRWEHPEKGIIPPNAFIEIFEKNGFISQMDHYVWRETCRIMKSWRDEGFGAIPVSVNVSRKDIYDENLAEELLAILAEFDIPVQLLHLEITETAYTENTKQVIDVVSRLRKKGFIIEMDDFGTGYSSLNMLSEMPVDILKLDMKFIQNESEKDTSKNILSFIISLAKWMGLLVIAEGVETPAQVHRLRSMECNYVQGYYYAKPLSEKDFRELMGNANIDLHVMEKPKPIIPTKTIYELVNEEAALKMFIVDDVQLNRSILAKIFTKYFDIIEADNGVSALTYLKEHHGGVDIVLLDLIMPIMDGYSVLEEMKADPVLKNIPVVVTSQAGESSEERALTMGADDFIAKPYNARICLHRIANILGAHGHKIEIQ